MNLKHTSALVLGVLASGGLSSIPGQQQENLPAMAHAVAAGDMLAFVCMLLTVSLLCHLLYWMVVEAFPYRSTAAEVVAAVIAAACGVVFLLTLIDAYVE